MNDSYADRRKNAPGRRREDWQRHAVVYQTNHVHTTIESISHVERLIAGVESPGSAPAGNPVGNGDATKIT